MDLEGYARKHLSDESLVEKLTERILEFKDVSEFMDELKSMLSKDANGPDQAGQAG